MLATRRREAGYSTMSTDGLETHETVLYRFTVKGVYHLNAHLIWSYQHSRKESHQNLHQRVPYRGDSKKSYRTRGQLLWTYWIDKFRTTTAPGRSWQHVDTDGTIIFLSHVRTFRTFDTFIDGSQGHPIWHNRIEQSSRKNQACYIPLRYS